MHTFLGIQFNIRLMIIKLTQLQHDLQNMLNAYPLQFLLSTLC